MESAGQDIRVVLGQTAQERKTLNLLLPKNINSNNNINSKSLQFCGMQYIRQGATKDDSRSFNSPEYHIF